MFSAFSPRSSSRRAVSRRGVNAWIAGLGGSLVSGCNRSGANRSDDDPTIVFKHQPLFGDPAPFRRTLETFTERTGIPVVTEALPSSSDAAHQFFLTSLEGGDPGFDVLVADVVWIAEFARAGWIHDLSALFTPASIRRDFIEGAANAVIFEDKTFAVPWYLDVGLLYRRTDLVPSPVRTYDDLVREALAAKARGAAEVGYVWQGRQYEGLVCNVFETIWGHGGDTLVDGRIVLISPEALRALRYQRSLLERGVSPSSVTSMAEEESRRAFESGRAAFMRNWPYAVVEGNREGSPIRGRFVAEPLPTSTGEAGFGTLGGYQLAVTQTVSPSRLKGAASLIEHLTSLDANLDMARVYGRNPPRIAAYSDARLVESVPHIAALKDAILRARPRPVTPYYALLADTLQSELSAAVSGIRSPEESLERAQRACDRIMGGSGR